MLTVRLFRTAAGRSPVAEFIRKLPADRAESILAAIKDLETFGLDGVQVTTRHIDGKLWELKFPIDRVFYVVITGPAMILLHAYKKQGQKAPHREIETARKRMRTVLGE